MEEAELQGDKLVVKTNDFFKFPKEFNNRASSFKNRAGIDVRLYAEQGGHRNQLLLPGRCEHLVPGYCEQRRLLQPH